MNACILTLMAAKPRYLDGAIRAGGHPVLSPLAIPEALMSQRTHDATTPSHDVTPTGEGVLRKPQGLTDDGRFRSGRLAGLGMGAAIIALSWPVMIESFLNSLVGLTDTVLAAGLGIAEADAIAGASYIMWFIGLVIMAVGVGATAMISRAVGAGRLAAARAVLGQSVLVGLLVGSLTAGGVLALAGPVAGLMRMTDAATASFVTYMQIIAFGVPGASMLFILTACARGAGDSRRPLYAMIARNLVNIAVSFLLSGVDISRTVVEIDADGVDTIINRTIIANPASFDLGILGIAIGTVAGDLVGAAILLGMALRGTWGITLLRRRLVPHLLTIKRLVNLGWPNFLETSGMWFGNFLLIVMVGVISAQALAAGENAGLLGAHMIAIRIEAMSFLPGFAMGTAAATLAGQYLGARRSDMAKRAVMTCAGIAATIMLGFGIAFVTIPRTLVSVLSAQPEHLETTPTLLFICGWVQVPFALGIVFRTAMRGAGDVKVVMGMTWISTYLIRLPLAFLLSGSDIVLGGTDASPWIEITNPMPDDFPIHGLWGMWIGMCTDLVLRGVIFTWRFVQGGWMKAKV